MLGKLGASATDYLRRPDMCILEFNRLRLTIRNPNRAGLKQAEMRLAEKVNTVIDGYDGSTLVVPSRSVGVSLLMSTELGVPAPAPV